MKFVLFVEGGGETNDLASRCREGFRKLLQNAGITRGMPRIVACGDRIQAMKDYTHEANRAASDDVICRLVDSEDAVLGRSAEEHLLLRDRASLPVQTSMRQVHLMVRCMEAWLLADVNAVADYYGKGFLESALPGNTNREELSKEDVQRGLRTATKATQKGGYSKARHSFSILAEIDPRKLESLPHAHRWLEFMRAAANDAAKRNARQPER